MALSYWGWDGDRMDAGKWLKPFDEDLNVMPYEMASYAAKKPGWEPWCAAAAPSTCSSAWSRAVSRSC
jgi:hypothetical protein